MVFIGCAYGLMSDSIRHDVHAVFIGCAYGIHRVCIWAYE